MTDQTSACGCTDYTVSRRSFLRGVAALGSGAMMTSVVGDVFSQAAFGATAGNPSTLVVLSLRGGADGLSMVVPHGDPGYASARPSIAVPASTLVGADAMFGLHPGFAPLAPMWQAGTFGAVHAVGLPQPNRSHFAAMEAIEDADPGSAERRGWINRMIGIIGAGDPVTGVQLGSPYVPTSLYGASPNLGLTNLTALRLPGATGSAAANIRSSLNATWGSSAGSLGSGARSAIYTSDRLSYLSDDPGPRNGAQYPGTDLGGALTNAAALIRAQVGARVITLDCGNWDMHANLGKINSGPMKTNINDLAGALAAFFVDIGTLSEQVTVLTLSEFGRRVVENGDHGLDHGYGNCVLAMGAGINGGQVHGTWPGLGPADRLEGDLRVTTDYRSVLWEIVARRFPEVSLPELFPGFTAETVGIA